MTAATSPHLTAHGSRLTLRLHAPLSVESPLPSARAVRGLCLEVPLGTLGPDLVLYWYKCVCVTEQEVISGRKRTLNDIKLPRPNRCLKTQSANGPHIGREDSQLCGAYRLQGLSWAVSGEARTRGSGEVLCAKSRFVLVRQRTEMAHQCRRHFLRVLVR